MATIGKTAKLQIQGVDGEWREVGEIQTRHIEASDQNDIMVPFEIEVEADLVWSERPGSPAWWVMVMRFFGGSSI